MKISQSAPKRLDLSTFEMIFVVVLISLHDFLLSDALSLPLALRHSALCNCGHGIGSYLVLNILSP